jgi:hypothetical protein
MEGINITQNFTATKVDAYDVHEKTIAAIKLGSTVTVPPPSRGGGGKYGMVME